MSQRNDANKLFVGSLPADITQEELRIVFTTYGQVDDIHVMSAKNSTLGNASAFICYAKKESAEDAIAVLDGVYKIRTDPDAVPIKVGWARSGGGGKDGKDKGKGDKGGGKSWGGGQDSWNSWSSSGGSSWGGSDWKSQPSSNSWSGSSSWSSSGGGGGGWQDRGSSWSSGGGSDWSGGKGKGRSSDGKGKGEQGSGNRLFVGNLPADIQQDALEYVFGNYGKVVKVHIMIGRAKSGQSCAFIEYSTADEADVAIATLNDKYEIKPGDGNIMVKHAQSDKGKGSSGPY